jgi:VWFA-related protein
MKAILLVALFAVAASPQQAPSFRSDIELVALPCSVVDAHGAPVTGLTRGDFKVFDNDVPRIVEYLWHDSEQPVTLAVLMDLSGSQDPVRDEHARTAAELLKLLVRPQDEVFVITIAEEIRVWTDLRFTFSQPLGPGCPKSHGISQCGSSAIWDAVYDTARLKLRPVKGTKAILLLTDGYDSGSTHTWNQAADEAQKSDAAVYAIAYPNSLGHRYAPQLYRLVAETGGAVFDPPGANYGPIQARLENDLRRRYVLGFRPERLSLGKPRHNIRVEVTRADLTVRTRQTYFQSSR